jgi:hypothetical protein
MQGLLTNVRTWKIDSDTMSSTRISSPVIHAPRDVGPETLLSEPRINRRIVAERGKGLRGHRN